MAGPAKEAARVDRAKRDQLFRECIARYGQITAPLLGLRLEADWRLNIVDEQLAVKIARRIITEAVRAGQLVCTRESWFRPGHGRQPAEYKEVK